MPTDIKAMLRELGQVRREQAKRIQRKQANHLLNAIGYLIVSAAVVIVLLSL